MKKLIILLLALMSCSDYSQPLGCFVADQDGKEVFIRCVTKEQFSSMKNSRSYEGLTNKRFEVNCNECL